ncbi:HNH endonuclease [Caldinitratiruptor microaerophilus]|uniref:HNH nuclease domain-containing protein n=1 Tax=Caldinitratiruptor microaerophilus TaxID=671077 RepID=A0AA35CLJ6_9FIRM|nr:HNH endonuclease signature motif containing protein [Caldinitratiruptor microaerophilus]BDG59500.1 hypothetical protein caldi_05900 [Caldinitratiruptor microaerophilus]
MDVLYYWRPDNYRADRQFGFGYHLNQNSPLLKELQAGDHVWAFTRRRSDGAYVLAADLVVVAVTENRPGFRYGRYRVWGDLQRSRYFDVDLGPDFEPVVRALSVAAAARHLGQSFQGHAAVRRLSPADGAWLAQLAAQLPTLTAAAIYPEDRFEAALLHGIEDVEGLLRAESGDEAALRRRYLYEAVDRTRSRAIIKQLYDEYEGRCQVCGVNPGSRYRVDLAEGHHLIWLSRGGEDTRDNVAILCPNHHAAVHRAPAVFDFRTLSFLFPNGVVEPLTLNHHLRAG